MFAGDGELALPKIEDAGDCLPCWERLNRLGWNAGLAFVSHGAHLGIRVNEPSVLEQIVGLLPPGSEPAASLVVENLYSLKVAAPGPHPGLRRYHLLYGGIGQLARTRDLEEALEALESDLHAQVAARAKDRLFVHAGVVGWRGQALVLPGRSFSGKTRLTAALVRAGATYYSDEYAVFDDQGRVYPYAKPLSLRDEEGGSRERCPAEALGGQAGTGPLPVGMIVAAQFEAGARWRPRALSPGSAMLTLLDNTVQVRQHPREALGTLQKAAMQARAYKSKRGEADRVADWLLTQGLAD